MSPDNLLVAAVFALRLLIGFHASSRNAKHLVSGVTTVAGVHASHVVSQVLTKCATDQENSCLEIQPFVVVLRRLNTSLARWFHALLSAK
jgi:hypothetical protein